MYKKLVKLILGIKKVSLILTTILSGATSAVYFIPKLAKSLQKIYPQLNNDTIKNWVSFITDIDILSKEFKWAIYITIPIFICCIIVIIIRYINRNKEFIDEVIIGHESMSPVQFNVKTDNEYKIEEINLIDDMHDISDNYEQIKFAVKKQDKLIEGFKEKIDNKHKYSYMGIAHTPLILRIGNQLGDENLITLFHKKRNCDVFKKLSEEESYPKLSISKNITDRSSDELIVGLATTFEIKYEELKVLDPDEKNILMFKSESLGFDVITSKKQVDNYVKYLLDNVRKVVKDKNINKIHLVISSSVAMTFALGQALSEHYDPKIIIYHFDMKNPRKYPWGLELFNGYNKCLVVTSDESIKE